jgi:hypothetical protein
MELRKRRSLMLMAIFVSFGVPVIFFVASSIIHANNPARTNPPGGFAVFAGLVVAGLSFLTFIVAAMIGATAGSSDLGEGMFRQVVITGRSRAAIYLSRIPAGLGIVVPLTAIAYGLICVVTSAAPAPRVQFQGTNVPLGLTKAQFVQWAEAHPLAAICNFPPDGPPSNMPCQGSPTPTTPAPAHAALVKDAATAAEQSYSAYTLTFRYPRVSLMIETGLWVELEVIIAFLVALGLASLMGQRTLPIVLFIILQVIITPIASKAQIPYMLNVQRGVIGIAGASLEPASLPHLFSGGGPGRPTGEFAASDTHLQAALVVCGWLVVWTALGMWRMVKRDA